MKKCAFCKIIKERNEPIISENKNWIFVWDKFPLLRGHGLFIIKRHIKSLLEFNKIEWQDLFKIIKSVCKIIYRRYKTKDFNFGINQGKTAGQKIFHLHFQIIPRYLKDPRAGKGIGYILGEKIRKKAKP